MWKVECLSGCSVFFLNIGRKYFLSACILKLFVLGCQVCREFVYPIPWLGRLRPALATDWNNFQTWGQGRNTLIQWRQEWWPGRLHVHSHGWWIHSVPDGSRLWCWHQQECRESGAWHMAQCHSPQISHWGHTQCWPADSDSVPGGHRSALPWSGAVARRGEWHDVPARHPLLQHPDWIPGMCGQPHHQQPACPAAVLCQHQCQGDILWPGDHTRD